MEISGGIKMNFGNDLTPREKQVCSLVVDGKSNSDIAEILTISKRTAEIHRANALRKLNIKPMKAQLKAYFSKVENEQAINVTLKRLEDNAEEMFNIICLFNQRCKEIEPMPRDFELPVERTKILFDKING